MKQLFDVYTFRARMLPALLALFPALVAGSVAFPETFSTLGRAVASLAVSCGVLVALANIARVLGTRRERTLVAMWGGMPTTRWLRHRDETLDAQTKARYHRFLSENVPGLRLASDAEERLDPSSADEGYRSAVKWLLEHGRRTNQKLVFEENMNYGFARNALGLRPWAAGIAISVLFGVSAAIGLDLFAGSRTVPPGYAISAFVALLAGLGWLFFVSPRWVGAASEAYARSLLACCEQGPAQPPAERS